VKRLGDSVMATFPSAQDAVGAALDAQEGVDEVSVGEHRPLEAAACRRRTAGTVRCSRLS
jgi:class 3 adenylate cyclase